MRAVESAEGHRHVGSVKNDDRAAPAKTIRVAWRVSVGPSSAAEKPHARTQVSCEDERTLASWRIQQRMRIVTGQACASRRENGVDSMVPSRTTGRSAHPGTAMTDLSGVPEATPGSSRHAKHLCPRSGAECALAQPSPTDTDTKVTRMSNKSKRLKAQLRAQQELKEHNERVRRRETKRRALMRVPEVRLALRCRWVPPPR
jgi:hypothetical protein